MLETLITEDSKRYKRLTHIIEEGYLPTPNYDELWFMEHREKQGQGLIVTWYEGEWVVLYEYFTLEEKEEYLAEYSLYQYMSDVQDKHFNREPGWQYGDNYRFRRSKE